MANETDPTAEAIADSGDVIWHEWTLQLMAEVRALRKMRETVKAHALELVAESVNECRSPSEHVMAIFSATSAPAAESGDEAIIDQIDATTSAMFRLEQMVGADIDDPQRRALYRALVFFGDAARALAGRRGAVRNADQK